MDPLTSVVSLVYCSTVYASGLWDMLRATTPELATGAAEFLFVANDPTDEVVAHLEREAIPHVVQRNARLSVAELEALGIGAPEYIRRVYQGWNRAVTEARADCVVLLNSDHVMRAGWLAGLRARWTPDLALSPLVVEPPGPRGVFSARVGGGTGAVAGDHGRTLDTFDRAGFERQARSLARDLWSDGGVYMPVMLSRSKLMAAGLYPEGNLHAGSFRRIAEYGDRRLFRRLAESGVRHRTYHGVVGYHFQEGEMRSSV